MASRRDAALSLSYFLGLINRPVRLPPAEQMPEEIWRGSDRAICKKLGIRPSEYALLKSFRHSFLPAAAEEKLSALNMEYIARGDESYPQRLSQIHDPPPGLFIYSNKNTADGFAESHDRPHVAVVGARSASSYGIDAAMMLAGGLARASVCVVSGMALGVDTAAHRGALAKGGVTIAVLGCGADVAYPATNLKLYREIAATGAVISEYPPGTTVMPWRFPARNRIIAGLSGAVAVVEARKKSGALITADFCLDQGGEVCAVPGSIFSELSDGPNRLIREGATAITGAADILELIGISGKSLAEPVPSETAQVQWTEFERRVFKALSTAPLTVDELRSRSGISSHDLSPALLALELRGLIRLEPGKGFSRTPVCR